MEHVKITCLSYTNQTHLLVERTNENPTACPDWNPNIFATGKLEIYTLKVYEFFIHLWKIRRPYALHHQIQKKIQKENPCISLPPPARPEFQDRISL